MAKIETVISALVIIFLSIALASTRSYDSDALYAFSQAKDLIEYGSLLGWTFSANPFTVPDVILALPLVFFSNKPYTYYLLSAPIQLGFFAGFYSLYFKKRNPVIGFSTILSSIAISATMLVFIGCLLFRKPYFFMVEPFFIFVHHAFAALIAVLIFLYTKEDSFYILRRHYVISVLALIALTASDFYFAFYFGLLTVSTLTKANWRKMSSFYFLTAGISALTFIISWKLNPSVALQAANSLSSSNLGVGAVLLRLAIILSLPTAFYFWLIRINRCSKELHQLYFSLILITLFVFFAGLLINEYTFRYLTIVFPITIILFSNIVIRLSIRRIRLLLAISLVTTLMLCIFLNFLKQNPVSAVYKEELQCIDRLELRNSSLIAEYWPAKIIFESTGRAYNLYQVNSELIKRYWINNSRWESLYQPNGSTIIVTELLDKNKLAEVKIKFDGKSICNGKLLYIKANAADILEN
jgi:hypothetical protein